MFIAKIVSSPSVGARIIALALIPVVGFLANGIALMIGDAEVDKLRQICQPL